MRTISDPGASPPASALPSQSAASRAPVAGIKPVRIFIAEDHTALRQLLASHFSASACYEVVGQTAQGGDILEQCRRLRPQVLILDVSLPDLDGLEVITTLAQDVPETRVLVFSALIDPATVRRAINLGACGFVEKTADIDTLNRAVAAVSLGQPFYGDHVLQTLPSVLRGETPEEVSRLSPRECEVLALVANGHSSREIATGLGLSVRTVENHRSNIMHALGARNTADLTREALRLGLVSIDPRRPAI